MDDARDVGTGLSSSVATLSLSETRELGVVRWGEGTRWDMLGTGGEGVEEAALVVRFKAA